jgi:hypothetical protein
MGLRELAREWRVEMAGTVFSKVGSYGSGQADHGEKYHYSTCLATTDYTCTFNAT